jgi:SAM-dependent methyltransferase
MKLLDCGCGPGSITLGLAQAVSPGEVVGIDLEPRHIDAARLLAHKEGVGNARFEVASIYELPFLDGSFDAVYASTLFEHLSDHRGALREIRRVLRLEGLLAIRDPDWGSTIRGPDNELLAQMQELLVRAWRHNGGDPFYVRNVKRLLLEAGFERIETSYQANGTGASARQAAQNFKNLFQGFEAAILDQGWADAPAIDAMVQELEAWGERPDSLFFGVTVTALGWAGPSA